jgi:hypothetical protein
VELEPSAEIPSIETLISHDGNIFAIPLRNMKLSENIKR